MIGYSVIADCQGRECAPRDVSFIVGVWIDRPAYVDKLSIMIGDHVAHSTSFLGATGSSVGMFEMPDLVIRRILEEADAGGRISATVSVFAGSSTNFEISAPVIDRLRELANYLDDSPIRGIPGSPVRLVGHVKRNPTNLAGQTSVKLTLFILNDSPAPIHGWRGMLEVSDPFGDTIVSVSLTLEMHRFSQGTFATSSSSGKTILSLMMTSTIRWLPILDLT